MVQPIFRQVIKRTYDDFAAIPPDLLRWELIEGEFFMSPAPTSMHQMIVLRLARVFAAALDDAGRARTFVAPFDVILSRFNTVEPDLVVIKTENAGRISKRGLEGAPDLVVEVLSPSTRLQDANLKRALYAKFEVPEYWLVDPDARTVEVLIHTGDGYGQHAVFEGDATACSNLFHDIAVPLATLFAEI